MIAEESGGKLNRAGQYISKTTRCGRIRTGRLVSGLPVLIRAHRVVQLYVLPAPVQFPSDSYTVMWRSMRCTSPSRGRSSCGHGSGRALYRRRCPSRCALPERVLVLPARARLLLCVAVRLLAVERGQLAQSGGDDAVHASNTAVRIWSRSSSPMGVPLRTPAGARSEGVMPRYAATLLVVGVGQGVAEDAWPRPRRGTWWGRGGLRRRRVVVGRGLRLVLLGAGGLRGGCRSSRGSVERGGESLVCG